MEKFHKDKNKIKNLKVRKGIPLFINFCYNQKIRNELGNSKLFIENNELHYYEKHTTGGESIDRIDSTIQYIIKKVTNYNVTTDKIVINGEIDKIKNGNEKSKTVINTISLFRVYQNETKLIEFLDSKK